jgi:hypothetical protein
MDSGYLHEIQGGSGYFYVATPYSRWPGGLEDAFVQAAKNGAALAKLGVRVYVPIVHSHPIAVHGGIAPDNHEFWLGFDHPMMASARGLIVVKMDGWRDSVGVQAEIEYFEMCDKPIFYVEAV